MRIVFLDFDGVLNSRALVDAAPLPLVLGPTLIDAQAVARVERLCVEHDAAVVVTSTWRLTFALPELEAMLRARGLTTTRVLDVTPMIPHKLGRGQEIQRWLDETPHGTSIEGIVILDDVPDMLHLSAWHVESSYETGFADEHLEAARTVLARSAPVRGPAR